MKKVWQSSKQLVWEFKEFLFENDQTLSRIKNLRRQQVPENNPMMEYLKKAEIRMIEHDEQRHGFDITNRFGHRVECFFDRRTRTWYLHEKGRQLIAFEESVISDAKPRTEE